MVESVSPKFTTRCLKASFRLVAGGCRIAVDCSNAEIVNFLSLCRNAINYSVSLSADSHHCVNQPLDWVNISVTKIIFGPLQVLINLPKSSQNLTRLTDFFPNTKEALKIARDFLPKRVNYF